MTPVSSSLNVPPAHTRQNGSILISLAGAMVLLMVLLGSIQIGYAFYQERELEKAADLAALSGVQILNSEGCGAAQARALEIAQDNFAEAGIVTSTCGRWSSVETDPFVPDQTPYNALRTEITHAVPTLIPFITPQSIHVQTTALSTEPVAAFSIGSRLMRLSSTGLLALILRSAGLDVGQLDVLDAAGLANVGITPSGLLKALGLPSSVLAGVGSPEQLLRVEQLQLADLLQASLDLLGRSAPTDVNVEAAENLINLALSLAPLNVPIRLIGEPGVLAQVDPTGLDSALNTRLNLLDIVSSSIVLANGDNLARVELPTTPILGDTLTAAVQVLEPPTLAVGGRGTEAHNAQIRVNLHLNVDLLPLAAVNLPIFIDVASSMGELTQLCEAPLDPDQAEITVTGSITSLCIGGPGIDSADTSSAGFDSAYNACKAGGGSQPLLQILGLPVLSTPIRFDLETNPGPYKPVLTAYPSSNSFKTVPEDNSISLQLVGKLVEGLLNRDNVSIPSEGRDNFAADLVGPGAGIPISAAIRKFQEQSAESLATLNPNLLGLLSGTVSLVENVVGSLLTTVNDLVCGVHAIFGPEAVRQCRVTSVKEVIFSAENVQGSTAALLLTALSPVLSPLDSLLNTLLDTLGLNLGQTDVTLHAVQCGVPRLVE